MDKLLIPVHLRKKNHWCLAVVDMKGKHIKYYDSLGGHNEYCCNVCTLYGNSQSVDFLTFSPFSTTYVMNTFLNFMLPWNQHVGLVVLEK